MILRRITEHVKAQNWFAVGIDFFIVVVGVFIGLQVSNWNQELENRRIAAIYLERLKGDLRTEIKHYGHVQQYFGATRAHAIAALDAYARPADELDVEFLIDLYQASQQWNLTTRRGTFDELLATGRIDLISDQATRSILNNYYESGASRKSFMERNTFLEYRKTIRMHMGDAIQRKIREKCDDIYTITENNYYYMRLPEVCEIDIPIDIVKSEIGKLLANDEVRQELRFQLSSLDSILGSIRNGVATGEATLVELEKASQ